MLLKTILLLCAMSYVTVCEEISLSCTFDLGDMCQWSTDPRDRSARWRLTSIRNNRGICMTPLEVKKGWKHSARLWSPWMKSDSNVGKCLSFTYQIFNNNADNMKEPSISLLKHSDGNCKSEKKITGELELRCRSLPIWQSGQGNSGWNVALVELTELTTDFKLILEGTIPSGNPNAKICVDNITSSADPCQVITEAPIAAPVFHSWVEVFGTTFAGALALGVTVSIAVFVVCLFERKRQRGKKNNRIIRHADELDLPEAMTSASCDETNPMPQRYTNTQVGVGHPRLMGRAMSTPVGTNGQGGSYTMGKRNGPQPGMGVRSNSGQMSQTMVRGGMDGGWMMSSQHGDLMENDEYTIDTDYTTHRQMSVPANGYIPVASNMNQMDQGQQQQQQAMMYQNRPMPQPQVSASTSSGISNNPFGIPTTTGVNVSGQDTRSLAGSHAANFSTDENRATPGLPFYPPRYEEAMGFNQGQVGVMDEKPPLLPPRIPDGSGSSSASCSTPLPPAPPPLPLSGHPSAGRFMAGNEQ